MHLSVVTSTYNSSKHIKEFIKRISDIFLGTNDAYELIIVDDGSSDNTINKIKECQLVKENITLIELARNFGHHQAIKCGLEHCKGDLIFLIDCDLEEEPELYYYFLDELEKNNLDLVFGQQKCRRGNFIEKLNGNLYYFLCNLIADFKIPRNMQTIRIMRREYLKAFLSFPEKQFILNGTTYLTGFRQKGLFIDKKRLRKSSYNFFTKFQLFVRSITNYSSKPLYLLFCIGLVIFFISFIAVLYLVFLGLIKGVPVAGWLTIACLSWMGVGITILSNGILAIYIRSIFAEVKNRPSVIIRRIHKN